MNHSSKNSSGNSVNYNRSQVLSCHNAVIAHTSIYHVHGHYYLEILRVILYNSKFC